MADEVAVIIPTTVSTARAASLERALKELEAGVDAGGPAVVINFNSNVEPMKLRGAEVDTPDDGS